MPSLSNTSQVVANDLRRAERSINAAARDTAQFLLTTLDATETHKISPAFAYRTVKATVDALSALVESQHQMAMRAHPSIEKAGKALGLTVTNWGVGDPKPAIANDVSLPEIA
ncbi:hypothetical protein [Sphingomonas mollis]|uniref:Uncharacterized protein n=1 Tax=Sphingomonas mollis TaxID=2795726 RepID=A0ABS0XUA9_9SPHN|nr:hypothetical protein [Sphingomonas sp. BT553]MBJ6123628.1 hypothetical protein [Sphingomonas sp. BT553]